MEPFTGQPPAVGERVTPRVWTVHLDAAERGLTAVKVTCTRPACPPQRLDTAAGRSFATARKRRHPGTTHPRRWRMST